MHKPITDPWEYMQNNELYFQEDLGDDEDEDDLFLLKSAVMSEVRRPSNRSGPQ